MPTPSGDLRPTTSLPVHLTSALSSPVRQNGQATVTQITETGCKPESHSEFQDPHDGTVSQSLPQSVDTVRVTPASSTSDMTHRRTNSDFFVTPSSSPPASPGHQRHPQPLPARVGDRVSPGDTSSGERLMDTFFSRAPKKFEDLVLIENDQIPTAEFLECCRCVLPFFGKFTIVEVYLTLKGNILHCRHS